jgi:hypothetical protein
LTGQGLVALVAGVAGCGLLAAEGAKQVVHAVPARPRGQQRPDAEPGTLCKLLLAET